VKVFLTGGTGYLGGHIAASLREAGHEVVALARSPRRAKELRALGADVVEGDLLAPDAWVEALQGCEAAIHSAARVQSWSREPAAFHRVNVEAAIGFVERARHAGLDRILVTSSLFALGPSRPGAYRDERAVEAPPPDWMRASAYAWSKAESARRLCDLQAAGYPIILLFPTVLLGPGALTAGNHTTRVLMDIARGRLPGMVGDGEQVWNLVPARLAARGHVLALESGEVGQNYILGGEHWTQRQFVETAADRLGVTPPSRLLGTAGPLFLARALELWARVSGRAPKLTRGEILLYDKHWVLTSDKARRELEYQPAGVDMALEETAAWVEELLRRGKGWR
jgi:farnesol dehydrogenase